MSSDAGQNPAHVTGSGELTAVVLELTLNSAEPIGGSVGRAGEQERLPFCGWVDLMSAINSLRTATGEPDEPRPPG